MNSQRNMIIVSAATVIVAVTLVVSVGSISMIIMHKANAFSDPDHSPRAEKAPVVVSGNNIYVVWGTDKEHQTRMVS